MTIPLFLSHNATSVILRLQLDSTLAASGLTGLTYATANLVISTIADREATATAYTAAGSTLESITTLGTYEVPTATKCRFKEVDATNHPGLYEVHLADARWAVAGAQHVAITISGAANLQQAVFMAWMPVPAPVAMSMPVVAPIPARA